MASLITFSHVDDPGCDPVVTAPSDRTVTVVPGVRVVATSELKLFVAAVIESEELAGLVHLYFSQREAYATAVVDGLVTEAV